MMSFNMSFKNRINRRKFLTDSTLLGAGLTICPSVLLARPTPINKIPPEKIPLSWLDGKAPASPHGVAWGVPWQRGKVSAKDEIVLENDRGENIPVQSWTMAYWPDGSIKWTGLTVAADSDMNHLFVSIGNKSTSVAKETVSVVDKEEAVFVDTGKLKAKINKYGQSLITSLVVDGREVANNGRLIVQREDRSKFDSQDIIRVEHFTSKIKKVYVEQSGPLRAVIRVDGLHAGYNEELREWIPFTVRLYFTAGLNSIRMVHTFIFDGDQAVDFIKGVGLTFAVPFREEIHNRHIRFATENHNLFSEPVMMVPGYRQKIMEDAESYQRDQLAGKRVPNLSELTSVQKKSLLGTATWDSFKLKQLTADSWEIAKQTNPSSAWVRVTGGKRARGLAYVGDVSGGLAVGLKRFWQKYPTSFEITNASTDLGDFKVWFWSPDSPAMDMRHYDTKMQSLDITYEDDRNIENANSYGCANTSELMLWATPDTPTSSVLDAMADINTNPPLLICSPEYYHQTKTLGVWSLPGQEVAGIQTEDIASADTQLDRAFTFFSGEVDRRSWYGFWDFGDYRRTYDPIRNQWMYDIGGHGWNATELMPNVWLWFAFLRSGRADIFRAAEDMTRNTLEVDVYHLGPFAGLGSRHNVSHWGDGCKEPRINIGFMKRFYYYLTTDERTGDLISEPIETTEKSWHDFLKASHPDSFNPKIRIGPDWLSFASNWLAEWERTGNSKYRDYCLTGMQDIGNMPEALLNRDWYYYNIESKHLDDAGEPNRKPGQFLFLFAGDQIAMELISLIDCPEFTKAWNNMCEQFVLNDRTNWYYNSRITAYSAQTSGREDLKKRSLELYQGLLKFGDNDYFIEKPEIIDGPHVTKPVILNLGKSSFTPALATPEVSQWAINLMTIPELLR